MGEQQYMKSNEHSWWPRRPPWMTLLLLLSVQTNLAHCTITCGPGIKSAGGTVPRGDIVLEYGKGVPLEITCILDPDNEIVQNLFHDQNIDANDIKQPSQRILFYKNAERVPMEYVSVINSTAAKLHIPDPPVGSVIYYCKLLLDKGRRMNQTRYDLPASSSYEQSALSTVQPTSLETSGPLLLTPPDREIGVCLNKVDVGYKPLHITNFTCISDNWVSLTCNWTKPENPVNTKYKLFFRLHGRAGGRTIINCPTDSDILYSTCYWDVSTHPIYRQLYEYYYFTLHGENSLGTVSTPIVFHHYGNIIPASPINISVVNKTQSSAFLRWSVGTMSAFPRDLMHKIEYKSQWDSNPEQWHFINVSEICNASLESNYTLTPKQNCREPDTGYYCFNVTDLKYPFTHYDFRIYVRSSVARGEDKWSAPGRITLKTKSTIPKRPPRTDIGSFESVTSPIDKTIRDVFIYWQNIEDNEKCGESFEYLVYYTTIAANNSTIFHCSNETYKNYAKFNGLSTSIAYNFTIYSVNKEGFSEEFSTVYVPSESDKLEEPLSFTKMAFDEKGIFELSWKNASSKTFTGANQLNDYTIFWCENDKDRPYQCNGYMNWVHIPSSESCYNVTVSDDMKIYQFAISANSKNSTKDNLFGIYQPTSSSGMVWASCTVLHNKIVGKIKNVWINMIGPTYMELRWKLDCSDRIGAVLGFRIFYCPVVSINNSACKEPMLNKTIGGEMAQDSRGLTNIMDLKPYTTYMVTIALITKHGEGLHSDPLLNTTLEGAPDIKNFKIISTDITNTSVMLHWSPPKFANGIVRYYHVYYYLDDVRLQQQQDFSDLSDELLPINVIRQITVHDTKYRLKHLESFRIYTISISACTIVCSERSQTMQVHTAVGLPGRISQPNLYYENSTRIAVSWAKPLKPAGPVNYYQLIVSHHSGPTNSQSTNDLSSPMALASTQIQENPNNFLYRSESINFHVPVPDCNEESDKGQQTYSFAVRAVNNNPHNPDKPYYGPWSVPGTISCVLPGLPLALHLVIWSCLFIVLSFVSTYCGRRFWRKYKIMHNVQVVLPPTLNINFKFDPYHNFGNTVVDSKGQHYYVEEGHIVYDTPPADSVVHSSSASSGGHRILSNAASTSSVDRRPSSSRWSPATATTMMVTTDDDGDGDSSSSKRNLILPPVIPTTKCDNSSDSHSVKSSNDEVTEPSIVPVLPFFSLPVTTPIFKPAIPVKLDRADACPSKGYQDSGLFSKSSYQDGGIGSNGNGYQDGGANLNSNGYQGGGVSRNGYQASCIGLNGNGYQARGVGHNGNGYQAGDVGLNCYQDSGVGRNGNGYQASDVCLSGYQAGDVGLNGYQDSGVSRNGNGYQHSRIFRNNGYQDCRIGLINDCRQDEVASTKLDGYQDSGLSCAGSNIDCRRQDDDDTVTGNSRTSYDDVKLNQAEKVVGGDKCDDTTSTTEITTINCCVGEQQQLLTNDDDNNDDDDDQLLHQLITNHPPPDEYKDEPPAVEEPTVCVENRLEKEEVNDDDVPVAELIDDEPPQDQHDCSEQIVVAADESATKNNNEHPASGGGRPLSSTAYVMMEMVNAQNRVLDLDAEQTETLADVDCLADAATAADDDAAAATEATEAAVDAVVPVAEVVTVVTAAETVVVTV